MLGRGQSILITHHITWPTQVSTSLPQLAHIHWVVSLGFLGPEINV